MQRSTHWREACRGSRDGHTRKQEAFRSHGYNNQTNSPHYGAAHVPTTLPRWRTASSLDSIYAITSSPQSLSHHSISPLWSQIELKKYPKIRTSLRFFAYQVKPKISNNNLSVLNFLQNYNSNLSTFLGIENCFLNP